MFKLIVPNNAKTFFFTYATDGYAVSQGYIPFKKLILYSDMELNLDSSNSVIKDNFKLNSNWKVNNSTLGSQINSTLANKILLFEDTLNTLGHTVESYVIGKSFNNTYDIKGYVVTPENGYDDTIAISAHVHGNEKHSPLGFIQVIEEIKKRGDDYNYKLRNRTRFLIIFMCNPWGYINNNRLTANNVNINRNTDYRWALNTNDEADKKGSAPNSEPETQAIVNFFTPYKNEIDYHLDLHDMTYDIAYAPANNKLYKYTDEMNNVRVLLEKTNNTPTSNRVPYINEMGSVGNFFNENLGVNSITIETSRTYWTNKKLSSNFLIAKACEQVLAYLHLYFKIKEYNNESLLKKDMITAFKSEQYGINTWNNSKLTNYINTLDYTQSTESNGLIVWKNTHIVGNKNVLIVGGYNDSSLNAKLTLIRTMEAIQTFKGYSNELLNNINLIFLPLLNDSDISKITELISTYSIEYSFNIKSITDLDNTFKNIVFNSDLSSNLNSFIKNNYQNKIEPKSGVETYLNSNYVSVQLANIVPESSRYGFSVKYWVESIVNSVISKVF